MELTDSAFKNACNRDFVPLIRAIIYHPNLHWGAKVLGFALLDLPKMSVPSNAALARKLKTSPSQISVWRQELIRNKFSIRVPKF